MSSPKWTFEITKERENKLIGRKELLVLIKHVGMGTPARYEVRERIAKAFNIPIDLVYVRSLRTEYGKGESIAEVHIYNDPKRALAFEPEHIRIRNLPPEERKKVLEAKRRG
ncbi:MAG: 30S ribosomal protein S24e [Thermoprotei archaeon]|nr:MAG: 30S ribosomal protein S24e [Thermoprotei archaeon]RLF20913.1 MAG: 30S ribosomal protein S24e [Thermoprotei archaeon]